MSENADPLVSEQQVEKPAFTIQILGRTLEHLGVQMYKQRTTAIAELVANAWDAGSNNVSITVPESDDYDRKSSKIIIEDDGNGMNTTEIQSSYLVVGRNRRTEGSNEVAGRPVMGRKGIGKLAGFGIAEQMFISTKKEEKITFLKWILTN